jgi:hypothetical protein
MVTRAKVGIHKLHPKYANFTSSTTPISCIRSVREALKDENWHRVMKEKYGALKCNRTWTLVPRPTGTQVITGKWVLKHKFHSYGTLEHYKAPCMVRSFHQRPGIDFSETFSPVIKLATIHTVLTLVAAKDWPVHYLDVSNTFLHGDFSERVHCQQPTGFKDVEQPNIVCLLCRSLYGLRQAPRAWFTRFARTPSPWDFSSHTLTCCYSSTAVARRWHTSSSMWTIVTAQVFY